MASAAVATAALVLVGGSSAMAGPGDSSNASAQFLSGSLLSAVPVGSVAGLGGASASNAGSPDTDVDRVGLDVTALSAINVQVPGGVGLLPLGQVLVLGAVNQYAEASDLGVSRAASGAVSDDGAVSVGGGGDFPASAGLRLQPLLGGLSTVVGDLQIDLEAITGVAALDDAVGTAPVAECDSLADPEHCLDYSIAGGELRASVPAIAGLTTTLTGTGGVASTVDGVVNGLAGPNGSLARALAGLNAALTPLLGNTGLNIAVSTNVTGALNTFLDTPLTQDGSAVSINLRTGQITADLDALLAATDGSGLSNLAPGTEILSGPVLATLVSQVSGLLNQVPTLVSTLLTSTLNAATLTITGNVCLVGSGASCSTPIVDIGTGININVNGTLGQVIAGTAPATITLKAAGLTIPVSVSALLGALAAPITAALFNPTTGVVATVTGSTSPLTLAVTGVIGTLSGPLQALNTIVSLQANVQEQPVAGVHRVSALRLSLLGSALAQVDLGSAQVGPNVVLPLVAPTVLSLTPSEGPTTGGQTVTVTGTSFVDGATTVTVDGTPVPAADVTVESSATLSYLTPAHAVGPVDVTVTNEAGTSAPLTYTYVAAPTTASLTPPSGPTAGGTVVTIAGDGFTPETVVTIDGVDVVPTVNDEGDSLTFTTPPNEAGPVDVTVTTAGGTSTPALIFTYLDAPTTATLAPAAGPVAGGTEVVVTGAGFTPESVVTIDDEDVVPSFVNDEGTSLTFTTPPHAAGPVDVVVTTAGGTSTPALVFTYLDAPTAASLAPVSGPVAGGTAVVVTGTGFTPDSVVTIDGLEVSGVVNETGTEVAFTTPGGDAGPVDVVVTTLGGSTDALVFTYLDAPTAASLDPVAGPVAGGTVVTVTGTGFVPGSIATIDGVEVPSDVNDEGTELTFTTPAHDAGPVDVVVTTPGGSTGPLVFTYVDVPTAASLSPVSGPVAGGTLVTIVGTSFTDDSVVTIDGDVVAGTVNEDGTEITFTTPGGDAGPVDVVVTTAGGSTEPLVFTYVDAPTAESLTPESGPVAGGTPVTVVGENFVPGTVVVIDGIEVPVVIDETGTELVFLTPAHDAGPVDVVVVTPGGETDPLTYTYLDAPTAATLDPDLGPATGGTDVIVTGENFVEGSIVTIDGVEVPATVNEDGTEVAFTTPAHDAGPVDVVVTTPGGSTAPLTFTYVDAPIAASLAPVAGPTDGGTTVTITGEGFTPESVVTIDGVEVAPTTVAEDGLTLEFLTPAHAAGPVPVTVTTVGGTSEPLTFTYVAAPVALTIDPIEGPSAGGTLVQITGSELGFGLGAASGTTVVIGGVEVTPIVAAGTVVLFVTPPHAPGLVDVTVTTAGGTSGPLGFTYNGEAPTAESLSPEFGPVAGGTIVTVVGTDFTPESVVTIDGVEVDAEVALDGLSLTFTTPEHAAGPVDVVVTTDDGSTEPLTFTYVDVPSAESLSPVSGPVTGGTSVTVVGENFTPDSVVTIDGVEVPATVNDEGTEVTFTTPAHGAGPVDVIVTTPGGSTEPLVFTFVDAPTADSLSPVAGPTAGGTSVTVVGENFTPDSVVTIDGVEVPATVNDEGTEVTFTTPEHAAGPVDVVVTTPGGSTEPLVFTYVDAPTADSLSPVAGPTAGGTSVTVVGENFTPDSVVTIDGVEVPATVNDDGTELTFTTPEHAAGPVDVVVTTPGGSTEPLTFTYVDAPTADSLSPVAGPVTGGTVVTVVGENFTPDSVVTIDGVEVPATVSDDGTEITFTTPEHAAGPVDVIVTTPGGSTEPLVFTYVDAPTADSLSPVAGPVTGGTVVTVVGENFTPDSVVTIDGVEVPATVSDDGTELTFTTPEHAAGPVDVIVTTPGGSTEPLIFTYVDAPVAESLSPVSGPVAGGTSVTVVGENFTPDSVVTIDGETVLATVNDEGTEVTFTTPEHAAGPVDVVVTTPGGSTEPLTFTYVDAPVAESLSPVSGPVAGGTSVTVVGENFTPDSVVTIDGVEVPATVNDDGTELTFTTPEHAAGPVDVVVTTPGGSTEPLVFTYVDAPTADSLSPVAGPTAGGTSVTVVGENFTPDSVVTIDGETVPATVNDEGTEVTFTTPAHEAGPVDVVVTTPGGSTEPLVFTYVDAPSAESLSPVAGPVAGGTSVTVVGENFTPDSVVTIDGETVPATVNDDGTEITFTTPAHEAGPVDVVVTTPGGSTEPLTFTYVDAPSAESLSPVAGPVTGGTVVTIVGENFTPDSVVTIDGVEVPATVNDEGTEVTFTTPADEAGPVDVIVTTPGGSTEPLVFTYVDAPVAESLSPVAGPVAGGTVVTVVGENFTPDSVVTIDGVTVPATVNDDGTELTFTTPEHAAGPVDVVVTTPGGSTEPLVFTYVDAPVAESLSPVSGPVAGGTSVTVVGENFTPDSVVTIDGVEVPATVNDEGTEVTFTTPAHEAGPVDVVVTTPGGSTEPLVFTYVDAPTADSLSPVAGPVAGGTVVTIVGENFTPDSVVTIDGVTVPATVNDDGTEITFTTPAHEAGPVDVVVTTPGGATEPLTFTYVDAPVAESLSPVSGPVAGGTSVTVVGENFTPDSVVTIDGVEVPATVNDEGTEVTFTTPEHAAGPVDVVVTTSGGSTEPLVFTYVDAPSAESLSPVAGPVTGGTVVTVVGENFTPDSVVTIDGVEVPATVNDEGTELTFTTPEHAAGPVDVVVTTPGGSTEPLTFTYVAAPVALTIDPIEGPSAGGTLVQITGSELGFGLGAASGTTVVIGGVEVTPIVAAGTVVLFVTPPHAPGLVDVTVTTAGGTSGPLGFTYNGEAPTAESLSPEFGPVAGGTIVTVVGTDFTPESVVTIDGVEVDAEVALDGLSLTFTTPEHAAGPVDVVVTTDDGSTEPLTFTYVDAPVVPVITGLDPVEGPAAGGTDVTVTGTGFSPASVVTIGDDEVTPTDVSEDGTTIVFTTPGGEPGPVDVTVTTSGGESAPQTFTYLEDDGNDDGPTAAGLTPGFGPVEGGTEVTVTGSDFAAGSVVTIGGIDVDPLQVAEDGTSLTFLTPAVEEAGAVGVTVTTEDGTSQPLPFTYVDREVVVDGPGVPGGSVPVTGECWPPGVTVTVQLQTKDGVAVGAPVTVVTGEDCTFEVDLPIGTDVPAGEYEVVVTDETGGSTVVAVDVVAPALTIANARQTRGAQETNTVRGTSWEPGTEVALVAFSTPLQLGTVLPLADGTFELRFATTALPVGTHTVQATQTRSNGQVVVREVTFEIVAAPGGGTGGGNGNGGGTGGGRGGGLATTGAGILPVAIGALVLLGTGAGLVVRRRRTTGLD
ncbi:IPT/TIG domain-containing protein [Serinibacter arcticus]|uniref:IPT/TIG domain-containing protein n=1 Tax=Serinibacter arcticus TaxID=1655435 RepID=UPI0013053B0A|nr:IPT/TIG domain-containing protein [Serinibacter arcticus]